MARGRMGGNMNYNNMIKQAQKMQADMVKAQQELDESEFSAQAGGGALSVVLKGDYTMQSIEIDPDLLEDGDVEMLQDLIISAINDAVDQINVKKEDTLGAAAGGMRMPF